MLLVVNLSLSTQRAPLGRAIDAILTGVSSDGHNGTHIAVRPLAREYRPGVYSHRHLLRNRRELSRPRLARPSGPSYRDVWRGWRGANRRVPTLIVIHHSFTDLFRPMPTWNVADDSQRPPEHHACRVAYDDANM